MLNFNKSIKTIKLNINSQPRILPINDLRKSASTVKKHASNRFDRPLMNEKKPFWMVIDILTFVDKKKNLNLGKWNIMSSMSSRNLASMAEANEYVLRYEINVAERTKKF